MHFLEKGRVLWFQSPFREFTLCCKIRIRLLGQVYHFSLVNCYAYSLIQEKMTPLNATKVDLCVPRKVEQLLISIKVSECVCVFLRPFTMKASSVWINWNTREQINNVQLIKFFSYAKSLQHYFRVKHLTFLTNHFILFLH